MEPYDENTLQDMVDGMSARWQRERATTQWTLGKFIEVLETMPSDMMMDGIKSPHSYRGYYIDLAFEKEASRWTVEDTLKMLRGCLGEIFTGYKGGEFGMTKNTPVWVAHYGTCGKRITGINTATGELVLEDDNEELE